MVIIIPIVTTAIGIIASLLIARSYYLKSLAAQGKEFFNTEKEYRRIIEKFAENGNSNNDISKQLLREKRLEQCVQKYVGTGGGEPLLRVIDTYPDLSDEEKADMLDTALLRARGRKAKDNPYRNR